MDNLELGSAYRSIYTVSYNNLSFLRLISCLRSGVFQPAWSVPALQRVEQTSSATDDQVELTNATRWLSRVQRTQHRDKQHICT